MRGLRKIQVAVLLLMLGAAPAMAAEENIYTLINASATRVDYAQQGAHMLKGGFVSFTVLTVLPAGPVAWSLSNISINCGKAQIATLSNANYAANGAPLAVDAVDSAVQPITPGTLGQFMQVAVCNGVDPYPRSKPMTGLKAAVAKARDLFAAIQTPGK